MNCSEILLEHIASWNWAAVKINLQHTWMACSRKFEAQRQHFESEPASSSCTNLFSAWYTVPSMWIPHCLLTQVCFDLLTLFNRNDQPCAHNIVVSLVYQDGPGGLSHESRSLSLLNWFSWSLFILPISWEWIAAWLVSSIPIWSDVELAGKM